VVRAPAAPRTINPEIPEALDRLISRCLDPDASKRFQTTVDLEAELSRLDDHGVPIPVKRVVGMRMVGAIITLAAALLAVTWWYATLEPPPPPDPVSVVIADVQNLTGDAAFNGTIEPMLMRALEGAGFITAYDRDGMRRILGAPPPERLDEEEARKLAVGQGLGVVVAGSIAPQANGYRVSVRATRAVTARSSPPRRPEPRTRMRSSTWLRGSSRGFAALWVTTPPSPRRCSRWQAFPPRPSKWSGSGWPAGMRRRETTTTGRSGTTRGPSSWIRSSAWGTPGWRTCPPTSPTSRMPRSTSPRRSGTWTA
jgi:hypothetical protein